MDCESKHVGKIVREVFLIASILFTAAMVHAQRGGTGYAKPNESPDVAAGKSAAPAGKVVKGGKSTRSTRARHKATSSKHETGPAAAVATGTDAVGNKKRERRASKTSTASVTKPARAGRCDPEKEERADLAGIYSGKVNYPDGGLDGDATLTISGNRFTLTAGSKTETGNITAVTTCTYTAVAMMFGEWKTPQPGEPVLPPLPMFSLKATKKGDLLSLKPSASERRVFSFESAPKK
jgi:hypothetical protein